MRKNFCLIVVSTALVLGGCSPVVVGPGDLLPLDDQSWADPLDSEGAEDLLLHPLELPLPPEVAKSWRVA